MPDRIYVMNNRDFNLGVANHADKWAVFWLFTVCTFFIPRCLQWQRQQGYHRMIRLGKEAAAREARERQKKIEQPKEKD